MNEIINGLKAVTYWRKAYTVEAIRLTDSNMQTIADYLGAELCIKSGDEPFINHGGDEGHVGEWLVKKGESFRFYLHEDFMRQYHTHDEQMANDEKYARVFQLVNAAMRQQDTATYYEDQTGIDIITIETTKRILREL
jgi:hypothetical protein